MRKYLVIPAVTALIGGLLISCGTSDQTLKASNETVQNAANTTAHDMSNMDGHDMSKMDEMRSAPDANKQPYDLQFIDTMIFHHQGAIKMAQMVLGKTERAELKAFAQKIIDEQSKEIELLKKWRDEWYPGSPSALNIDLPGMMNQGMKIMNSEHLKSMDEMEPAHFDNHFFKMMTPHHQGAIEMANDAMKRAGHQEIRDLAKRIIAAQTAEIKQMEKWKAARDKE